MNIFGNGGMRLYSFEHEVHKQMELIKELRSIKVRISMYNRFTKKELNDYKNHRIYANLPGYFPKPNWIKAMPMAL